MTTGDPINPEAVPALSPEIRLQLEKWIEDNVDVLLRHACKIASNRQEAEDALGRFLVDVCENWHEPEYRRKLADYRGYAFRCVTNRWKSMVRSAICERQREAHWASQVLPLVGKNEESYETVDVVLSMPQVVSTLAPTWQAVLRLYAHHIDDQPFDVIAQSLGISVHQARCYTKKALTELERAAAPQWKEKGGRDGRR